MKGRILIVLGFLLVASSVLLVAYNMNLSIKAQESCDEVIEYIEESHETSQGDWVYKEERYSMMIAIPSIGVQLPVIKDYAYEKLDIAPCIYSGSIYTDNLVICGHNYRSQFGSLSKVPTGSEVILTTAEGVEYRYTVAGVEELERYAVEEMTESDADLTIFTCSMGGKTRYAARCSRQRN